MARTIMVDPAKLEAAAQKMDSQAAEYQQQYNKLFSEVDGMAAAWQGADNIAFTTQIKGFMDDFQKMVQIMNQYSEFLRLSAKTYRETQNEIISAAKRLTN
jgi:WXG100 family type VII secretion target